MPSTGSIDQLSSGDSVISLAESIAECEEDLTPAEAARRHWARWDDSYRRRRSTVASRAASRYLSSATRGSSRSLDRKHTSTPISRVAIDPPRLASLSFAQKDDTSDWFTSSVGSGIRSESPPHSLDLTIDSYREIFSAMSGATWDQDDQDRRAIHTFRQVFPRLNSRLGVATETTNLDERTFADWLTEQRTAFESFERTRDGRQDVVHYLTTTRSESSNDN
jgi:hypothetical protein